MTEGFNPKEARALVKRLTGHTPGPWNGHNMVHEEGRQMTPVEIGEYVCNSVKMGDLSRFLFVSGKHDDGGDCDVCHTGNGPRGPANTALIAAAPDLLAVLTAALDRIEALEADIKGMRDSVAELEGFGRDWPSHGNVPLAIVAGYAIYKQRESQAWNDAIEAAAECVGHITQSEDRDAIMALRKGGPT